MSNYVGEWEGAIMPAVINTFDDPFPQRWFRRGEICGVDFEGKTAGCPPLICQIGTRHGVLIRNFDDEDVQRVLNDKRHIHAIFGNTSELTYVASAIELQRLAMDRYEFSKPLPSLVDCVNQFGGMKFNQKKKKKQRKWRGSETSERDVRYAALDAHMTYLLAERLVSFNTRTEYMGGSDVDSVVSLISDSDCCFESSGEEKVEERAMVGDLLDLASLEEGYLEDLQTIEFSSEPQPDEDEPSMISWIWAKIRAAVM